MAMRLVAAFVVSGAAFGLAPGVQGEIKVVPEKDNVVAGRLEGDWQATKP